MTSRLLTPWSYIISTVVWSLYQHPHVAYRLVVDVYWSGCTSLSDFESLSVTCMLIVSNEV